MSLHRDVLAAAIERCNPGMLPGMAQLEAEDLLDALAVNGWHLSDVDDMADRARARGSDPATSRTAADSIDDLSDRQSAVLFCLFEHGPMTDADMASSYPGLVERFPDLYPPQSPQSLRSRRSELVRAGHVIDSGQVGRSEYGRECIIWKASA